MMRQNEVELDDMPPGFEANRFSNSSKKILPVAQVKWSCPPKFVLNQNFQVASGEESVQRVVQPEREHRILEAIYIRLSSIPPSPSVSVDVEERDYDDRLTPVVPIIPIEEEEEEAMDLTDNVKLLAAALEASKSVGPFVSETAVQADLPPPARPCVENKPLFGTLAGVRADAVAAASAAFTALTKAKELGSMVDTDLLISILSDPEMIGLLKHVSSFDRTKEASQPPPAGISALLKNNGQESMVDTELLIKILIDPKMIGLLTDASSVDGVKSTTSRPPPKTMPMSGSKHATPESTTAQRTLQSVTSAFPVVEPERAQSTPFPRMEYNSIVSSMKPMTNKRLEYSSAVQKISNMPPVLDAKVPIPLAPLPTKSATDNLNIPLNSAHQFLDPLRANPDKVNLSSTSGQTPYMNYHPIFASKSMEPIQGPAYTTNLGTGYVTPKPTPPRLVDLTAAGSSVPPSSSHTRGLDEIPSTRLMNACVAPSLHPGWHGSHPPLSQPVQIPLQSTKVPVIKDVGYYKNLVKQHGTERQEFTGIGDAKPRNHYDTELVYDARDVIRENGKSCAYFNSGRGCRKGSSCPYQHDSFGLLNGGGIEEVGSMKRIKLMNEGIAGVYY
ncbi:Zinc finger CCCH domain-containing protein [Drosera capensis]